MNGRRALATLIRGKRDTRVRATWRGLHPLASFVVIAFGGIALLRSLAPLVEASGVRWSATSSVAAVSVVVYVPWLVVSLALAVRLDRRGLPGFGLAWSRPWVFDLAGGLGIGIVMAASPVVLGLLFGYGEVDDVLAGGATRVVTTALLLFLGFVAVALGEETAFRGIALRNFAEGLLARSSSPAGAVVGSLLASSVLFGAFHLLFPGGGGVGGRSLDLLVTSTAFGVLWGLAYVLTGQVALPVGVHLGYNVSNGAAFSVLVDRAPDVPAAFLVVSPTAEWFWEPSVLAAVRGVPALVLVLAWVYATRGGVSVAPGITTRPG